jgi:hypothetical protein
MYHKETTRISQGIMRFTKGTPTIIQGTLGEFLEYSTMPMYKAPQGILRVLCHVYIRYHKESLEYSAVSI